MMARLYVYFYVCQKSIDYVNFSAPNKPIYCMRRSNLGFGTCKLPFFCLFNWANQGFW